MPHAFPPTAWSLVRLAAAEGKPGAEKALDEWCRLYERPVLASILRRGYSAQDAEDLKQAFFAELLARNSLADADGARGKLRTYLLTRLDGFLIDQRRRAGAQKRGGGQVANFSDLSDTELHAAQPVDRVTPFIAYQRQWMDSLATAAITQLERDYQSRGFDALFKALAPFLTHSAEQPLADLALKLDRPVGTLKSDISRMRAKCQSLIREQVAATLDDPTPENVDAELKELMGYRG